MTGWPSGLGNEYTKKAGLARRPAFFVWGERRDSNSRSSRNVAIHAGSDPRVEQRFCREGSPRTNICVHKNATTVLHESLHRAHHFSIVSNLNRHRGFATDVALLSSCFAGLVLTFPPIKKGGKRDCCACDWRVCCRDCLTWGYAVGVIGRDWFVCVLGVFGCVIG